jgi:signal recognition particle receptor subunit beta
MVSINYASKDICCKIVFYGPGLSGKTTNLQYVYQKIPPQTRGELISLATDQDRTLYFDFLPVDIGKIHGFSVKFQLYTVPGQVYYNATRKLVLRGVDGLVFVADSQRSKMDENIESYQNLVENLEEYGYDIDKLPLVFQYNKRDLSNISSVEELERVLNPKGLPHFEAEAVHGIGVFDTLKCISKRVLDQAKGKKVAPEREMPVEQVVMAESKSVQTEKPEFLEKKEVEAISQEKPQPVLEEVYGFAHSYGGPSGQVVDRSDVWDHLTAQQKTEEEPLCEKIEKSEPQKEEMVSAGLTQRRQERKFENEQSLPKIEENPTIISWSATRREKKSEAKGFFLWRFFKRFLNR